ncbi:hypothetical protein BJF93_21910 [Xaviernesmea oryzae]|uniref:Uncharacterized protein n=1 Tax=Xaviernesmea oryzae TaxID=464029 RepID=A0A1Q9AWC1_9HYPH|nr:hypothetical protein BJF93_21910 [Xaviernesmea oryzae]
MDRFDVLGCPEGQVSGCDLLPIGMLKSEVELADELRQSVCFTRQGGAGGRGLLDHCCVLLGHLVHLIDGSVHLCNAGGLFLLRRRDRDHMLVDGHDMLGDRVEGIPSTLDQLHAALDLLRRNRDQVLNCQSGFSIS